MNKVCRVCGFGPLTLDDLDGLCSPMTYVRTREPPAGACFTRCKQWVWKHKRVIVEGLPLNPIPPVLVDEWLELGCP